MRHLRITSGLAVSVCAFAVAAAPALAGPVFHAETVGKTYSETERGKTALHGVEEQTFKFGDFEIKCKKAGGKGEVNANQSKTLFTEAKFTECVALAKFGKFTGKIPTKFGTPIDVEYHANGFAEVGGSSESTVKLSAPGPIELKISTIKCKIEIPPQTIPVRAVKHPEEEFSSAVYSNEEVETTFVKKFPSGFQKKLIIANEFKAVKFNVTEGQCEESEEFGKEGHTGKYTGVLRDEIPPGNLYIGEETF
jgi:hypothetical protein